MADKPTDKIAMQGMPLILRKKQLLTLLGLSRSTLYNLQKSGDFPLPVKLSQRATGWLSADIQEWLERKADERAA